MNERLTPDSAKNLENIPTSLKPVAQFLLGKLKEYERGMADSAKLAEVDQEELEEIAESEPLFGPASADEERARHIENIARQGKEFRKYKVALANLVAGNIAETLACLSEELKEARDAEEYSFGEVGKIIFSDASRQRYVASRGQLEPLVALLENFKK